MNLDEQLEYFEAMDWFNAKYQTNKDVARLLKYMYGVWPKATLQLAHQGFFMAITMAN